MNVYGLVGHTEGHSISQIAVGLKGPNGKVGALAGDAGSRLSSRF